MESCCGVICACLPTLRPLAKKVSNQFGSSEKSKSRTKSRGPTELVTIGGGGSHLRSRAMTKSPFQRLDEPDGGEADDEGALAQQRGKYSATVTTETTNTGYASSGDSVAADAMRTRSHGQEQHGKGFV